MALKIHLSQVILTLSTFAELKLFSWAFLLSGKCGVFMGGGRGKLFFLRTRSFQRISY